MKVETKQLEDREVELKVEVAEDRLAGAMRSAARRLSKGTRIPGFRPGKAPYEIILGRFGEEAVFEEALETLGQEVYRQALEEAKIDPYAQGTLEEVVERSPLVLRYKVPLEPEVDLRKYHKIRIPFKEPKAEDQAVDELMENLRQAQALIEPADRPAALSDVVVVDAKGELQEPDEDRNATLMDEKGVSVLLAEDTNWPIPGISEHLLGLKAGDEKEISYVFPDDYSNEFLRGKEARFEIKCLEVKSRLVPEWTDDLARNVGEYETLLDLRIDVREKLQAEATSKAEAEYSEEVIKELVEQAKVSYPPVLLEREMDSLLEDLRRRLASQKLGLEDYLRIENKTEEDLRHELEPTARERLLRALVLGKVVEVEEIEVDDEELSAELDKRAAPFGDSAEQMRKAIDNPTTRHHISMDLLAEKAMQQLMEIARGKAETKAKPTAKAKGKTAKADAQKEEEKA